MHHACDQGHAAMVSALLQHPEVNPNLANELGITPLMCAALHGYAAVCDALLAHAGVLVNQQDVVSLSPCWSSCLAPDQWQQDGCTALMYACNQDHRDCVVALLSCEGIDLTVSDHVSIPFLAVPSPANPATCRKETQFLHMPPRRTCSICSQRTAIPESSTFLLLRAFLFAPLFTLSRSSSSRVLTADHFLYFLLLKQSQCPFLL